MNSKNNCLAKAQNSTINESSMSHSFASAEAQKASKTASLLLKLWNLRSEQLGRHMGVDDETSWNILLDLYVSGKSGRAVVTSDLAFAYFVPKSTLARYVDYLCEKGLVVKNRDVKNKVRVLLSLTDHASQLLTDTLERMEEELRFFREG